METIITRRPTGDDIAVLQASPRPKTSGYGMTLGMNLNYVPSTLESTNYQSGGLKSN